MTEQTDLMYINIKISGIYTPYDYAENLVIGPTDAAYRKTILAIRLPIVKIVPAMILFSPFDCA